MSVTHSVGVSCCLGCNMTLICLFGVLGDLDCYIDMIIWCAGEFGLLHTS
jgi:hypothetical protein